MLHIMGAGEDWIDLENLDRGIEPDRDGGDCYPHSYADEDNLIDGDFHSGSRRHLAGGW